MNARIASALAALIALLLPLRAAHAQVSIAAPELPIVTLTASATMQVDNDRMAILLSAESENVQASVAANEVNAKMGNALAVAKTMASVSARTLAYTTSQVFEKGRMARWRVTQLLRAETADFAAGATLATRLQADGLLLASLAFSISPEARTSAVARLQHQALLEWQARAKEAAASMGYGSFTPGRLSVNVNDASPQPVARFATQAMAAEAAPPVAAAAGTSEISVSVAGEAILTNRR